MPDLARASAFAGPAGATTGRQCAASGHHPGFTVHRNRRRSASGDDRQTQSAAGHGERKTVASRQQQGRTADGS